MITVLVTKDGHRFHAVGELKEVKNMVEAGLVIKLWWYGPEGKKYTENFVFPDGGDAIGYYMTDSDASPLEEF